MSNAIGDIGGIIAQAIGTAVGGPLGGMIAKMAFSVVSGAVEQGLSNSGLPSFLQDAFLSGFAEGFTNFAGGNVLQDLLDDFLGLLTPAAAGQVQGSVDGLQQAIDDLMQFLVSDVARSGEDGDGPGNARSGRSGGGMSWLEAMAKAVGKAVDETMEDMLEKAELIDGDSDASASTDFTVAAQRFSMVINAATTAIKAAGEGATAAARKQ